MSESSQKESFEFEGKTIDEAIAKACDELHLSREKLNIEILTEGAAGFLGLVGAKKARISASVLSFDVDFGETLGGKTSVTAKKQKAAESGGTEAGNTAREARELTEGILRRMGFEFPVTAREDDESVVIEIEGDGSGILIGKGGQTLDALQYLVNKALNKNGTDRKRIILDTENYRSKRESSLEALALKLGEKAKRTGKPVTVNPMNAHDRRIVHLALQDDRELTTRSRGEGAFRKIIIVPGRKG
ncbi:MAG: hypothetical protein AVO39_03795 [delta proteobacterium MLS_D]|jgi:spoIIIJ-associated protein|nr:MAG: hypothetical protein AVO39_03795 [delta proteobacterium MLS_D]